MKNILRIFLLAILMLVANKVLFSDFSLSKSENKSTIVATQNK
jgi:hypothetical protein